MTNSRLYVDVHVLQTVPPSNLNRDDAGTPKQAMFGGVRRARVSSQAWKRATRRYFADSEPEGSVATRTTRIRELLATRLVVLGGLERDQAERAADVLLEPLKITRDKDGGKTAYLLFLGRTQIDRIAEAARDALSGLGSDPSDAELKARLGDISVQEGLMRGHPLDVALFGRMVADLANLNVDASVQVAHAISTHSIELEFDYFTAIDDENTRAETGAGMIGTVEFNSATLYRYATIGVHQLLDNLGGAREDTVRGVRRFLEGFVRSMPTGHQTSFAHRTLPDAVLVAVRHDQPVNLVSAFERPVRSDDGYAAGSLERLAGACREVEEQWGGGPTLVAGTYGTAASTEVETVFGPSRSFVQVLDVVSSAVGEHLSELAP